MFSGNERADFLNKTSVLTEARRRLEEFGFRSDLDSAVAPDGGMDAVVHLTAGSGAARTYGVQIKQRLTPELATAVHVLSKPVVSAPIVGATKPHHLPEAVAALDLELTEGHVKGPGRGARWSVTPDTAPTGDVGRGSCRTRAVPPCLLTVVRWKPGLLTRQRTQPPSVPPPRGDRPATAPS
jgi:hypothetical protein